MALCPLIAIALYRQNRGAAIGFARGLLAENQHPLPEKVFNPIRKACDEWQIGARESAAANLLRYQGGPGVKLFAANATNRVAGRGSLRQCLRRPTRHRCVYGHRGRLPSVIRGKRRNKNRRLE